MDLYEILGISHLTQTANDIDIKTLDLFKNELTKITSSDNLVKAIANWNSYTNDE